MPVDRRRRVERVLHRMVRALVRRGVLREHAAADLERVDEVLVAHPQRRELEAECGMLGVEPRGADAEQRPALARSRRAR